MLRKVDGAPVQYPDNATALSYPDWVVARLRDDLGIEDADAALTAMNQAPSPTVHADGYVQDLGSQLVAELVGATQGETVLDLCAAPGGKATAIASDGALVVAADLQPQRVGLVRTNVERLGADRVRLVVTDAARPPFRPGAADRVLLDAPCSGLGVLRRRPDARWRLEPAAVDRLAVLQCRLLDTAVALVRPGGVLVYSVCTLSSAETLGVDEHVVTPTRRSSRSRPRGAVAAVGEGGDPAAPAPAPTACSSPGTGCPARPEPTTGPAEQQVPSGARRQEWT